jgi:hypothetical protein
VADAQDGALSILLKPFNAAPLPVTDLNPRVSTQLGLLLCVLWKKMWLSVINVLAIFLKH